MKLKKIAIIGTVGLPAKYGGFETLAAHLVEHLACKWNISVYCSSKAYPKQQRPKIYKGARLFYIPLKANGVQSILYDCISIIHALFYADVLLILGVSGGFILPFVRLFTNKRILISIDGIEWKRNKWSKLGRIYLWMAEWVAVKFSHADIADNESIQDYTAFRYKTLSNIIEYGADHTLKVEPNNEDKHVYPFITSPYAFKVCRIEPENNIAMVLSAFSMLPKHILVMVGNWNNSQYGREIKAQYMNFPNLILLDPIYDQRALDVLRSNCYTYVHGHSAGGTNPSLVEAMFLGLPVIAFGVSYNKTTTEGKAMYFNSVEELKALITTKKITDLKSNALIMKEIACRRYTWKVIADKYEFMLFHVMESPVKRRLTAKLTKVLTEESLFELELGHLQSTTHFYEKR
jgi:glycosyltransferase involved in cell wall biosynthesis